MDEKKIRKWKICWYCDVKTVYIRTKSLYVREWYSSSMASFFEKNNYWSKMCPRCWAYVWCHKQWRVPKGRVAQKELRLLKIEAHKYFDFLWQKKIEITWADKVEVRKSWYRWLAEKMGIAEEDMHIGMFNEEECRKVIEICKPYVVKIETLW